MNNTYTCMCARTRACTYANIFLLRITHVYMHTQMRTHEYNMCVYINFIHIYIYTCIIVFALYTHAYIYIYIYIHTQCMLHVFRTHELNSNLLIAIDSVHIFLLFTRASHVCLKSGQIQTFHKHVFFHMTKQLNFHNTLQQHSLHQAPPLQSSNVHCH